jgi:hypothetical protein
LAPSNTTSTAVQLPLQSATVANVSVVPWVPPQPPGPGSTNDRRVTAYQSHRVTTRALPDFTSRPSNSQTVQRRRNRSAFPSASVSANSTASSSAVQSFSFDIMLYPYTVSRNVHNVPGIYAQTFGQLSGVSFHPEDPSPAVYRIFSSPTKFNLQIQHFQARNLFFSTRVDGLPTDNIATHLNHKILTHCSHHHILLPAYPQPSLAYPTANDNVTSDSFQRLAWSFASVGYSVNPRGQGPYQKLNPAGLQYDEMTLGHIVSPSIRKIKNPLRESLLLIICTSHVNS